MQNNNEAFELQLSEVEMLQSMYANPGEFVLDDPTSLEQIQAVLAGHVSLENLYTRIGFTVKIAVENDSKSISVEFVCQLPHEYPFVKPQIFTRAPSLCKDRHKLMRDDLNKELDDQAEGEICVGVLVEWLRERLYAELQYLSSHASENSLSSSNKSPKQESRDTLTRLWIYSHHIYSKIKRKDIQDWGQELNLRGFSMPGKPGVICAEGVTCDVDEFWYRIRRMNWKKICIKEQEVIPFPTDTQGSDKTSLFKFDPFFELVLDARGGKGREYHMDLGQFSTFLQEHDSGHVFSLFFGVSGKPADDGD
ncbi:RWD domain-containing protein 2b [Plakobranchus ocellatus]|uniref:RWD domain-containing protein 2b n=1 Tax=Plakobranchus ocellatus TaxID=259542 RepID=A0AAV4B4J7_9GAST|nr:RWD domain-containing protein 2b [Plakobranchus ocellatus]